MTVLSAGDDRTLSVRLDFTRFEQQMKFAPSVVYFRVRDYLGSVFGKHRQEWLRRKGTRFGRGGAGSRAIKVFGVNEGPGSPGPNQVVYAVRPKEQRQNNPAAAEAGLRAMVAEAFTGNIVLPVHEFGEDIRARRSRFMAIPVRTRPGTPAAWLRANPDKRLEYRPSKKNDGTAVLYEVQRKRKKGRPKKGEEGKFNEKLKLRFVLTRFVDMKPTLRMYATWQDLDSYRATRFARTADAVVRDIEKGVHVADLLRGA